MITLTLPWWGWLLYFTVLIVVFDVSDRLGKRLGRALYLRMQRKLTEWSRRG